MRRTKLFLGLALVTAMVVGSAASGVTANSSQSRFTMPHYYELDPDLQREAAARGQNLKGKDFRGYNPGHSYKSPGDGTGIGSIDQRGHGRKGLAILVDWPVTGGGVSDVPGVDFEPLPQQMFDDLVNGDSYNPYTHPLFQWLATTPSGEPAPTNLTMKNYYDEVSYGQFGMQVDMVGWVTLPKSYDYYMGQNKGYYNDNGDSHIGELVKDALMAADPLVDFSQYAVPAQPGDFADLYGNATSFVDKNGNTVNMVIPNLFIIHRGTGAEYSRDPSIIWSHKWDILSATYYGHYYQTGQLMPIENLEYFVVDGVAANTYNVVPEVGQDITEYFTGPAGLPKRPPSPPYVGVFAHEFGHVLGIPDLYDYGYDSEGVGMFSLMASGSYGRSVQDRWYSGNSPVHMDAWNKAYLGFVDPVDIYPSATPQSITLRPVHEAPDIYRVHIPGADGREYFLLENRQQGGFDKGLAYNVDGAALHGLVVYQVDENLLARNFWRPNEAQNYDWNKRGANFKASTGENHYGVSVVQADGRFDMERYVNDGDAGDVFPGKLGVRTLGAEPVQGKPNTVSWYQWSDGRSITGITFENITEHADGTVTLDVLLK